MNKADYVKASEIGEYVFCKRGWWLQFNGKLPTTQDMIQGTLAHEKLAQDLRGFDKKRVLAGLLIGIGIILLILYYFIHQLKL